MPKIAVVCNVFFRGDLWFFYSFFKSHEHKFFYLVENDYSPYLVFLRNYLLNKFAESLTGMQPNIFQGWGGFVELGHFDKHFVKNTRKRGTPF